MLQQAGVAIASSAWADPTVSGPSCGRPSGTAQQDVEQFANAANAVIAGLDGAGIVAPVDVSSGVSNPALVLIAEQR